jgi:hypothetical protein
MAVLTITTCPHCGAEMEAFHHTRWETMESRTAAWDGRRRFRGTPR